MNNNQNFFIGPMSKQIVDCILRQDPKKFGLIPSRRQVDYNFGYVNNWNSQSFSEYVKQNNSNFIICRDHGGASQGSLYDDGYESFEADCKYFDMIHVDPWKFTKNLDEAIVLSCDYIRFCNNINKNIVFEIATEESIFYFDNEMLKYFIDKVYANLGILFDKITHIIIQSGTRLKENNQIGKYSSERLVDQLSIVKKFEKLSKEHNGDYMSIDLIKEKFNLGLDSINIAPEFGYIQTLAILEHLDEEKIHTFYDICYRSGKWKNWVDDTFDPEKNKLDLIKITGHYVYSNAEYLEKIHDEKFIPYINEKINQKLGELSDIC